jgi:four helix bundle protein
MGSLEETKIWLLFSRDCGYMKADVYEKFCLQYDEIGAKLYKLYENWKTF